MSIDILVLEKFFENHSDEAVKTLSLLPDNEIISVIEKLSNKNICKIFSRIESYRAIKIFDLLNSKDSAEILRNIPTSTAIIIIRQLNQDRLKSVLSLLTDKEAIQFSTILQYDELSVGAFMNSSTFTLTDDIKIKDALEIMKRYEGNIPAKIITVSRDMKLSGFIKLQELIRLNPNDEIRKFIHKKIPKVLPQANINSILDHAGWHDHYSLPVTDEKDILLGAINLENIRSYIENKSKKDFVEFNTAGRAIGELFRIGLSGLIRSAAEIGVRQNNK